MQLIFVLLPRPVLELILLHFMRTSDTYQKQKNKTKKTGGTKYIWTMENSRKKKLFGLV